MDALTSLAGVLLDERKFQEAESVLRGMSAETSSPPGGWTNALRQTYLGASLAGEGKRAEAEPLLRAGYLKLVEQKSYIPADHLPDIEKARRRLAESR